jgi:aspartyl protease family protein
MRILLISAVLSGIVLGAVWPSGQSVPAEPPAATDVKPRKTVLERSSGGAFYATALVNGVPVEFIVDTGAELVALSKADAQKAKVPFDEAKFEPVARTASGIAKGEKVHIASIDLEGKRRDDVGGMVIEGLDVSLLGQNYLQRLEGVEMSGDKMILR